MSRTLDSAITAELAGQNLSVWHVAKIDFVTPAGVPDTVQLSEGPSTFVLGTGLFTEGTLRIDKMSWGTTGIQKCTITLMDYSGSVIQKALTNQLADTPITIWQVYETTGTTVTTEVILVTGTLDPVKITVDEVTLDVVLPNINTEFFPSKYCTKEAGFNHLAQEGQLVDFNGETFKLEID